MQHHVNNQNSLLRISDDARTSLQLRCIFSYSFRCFMHVLPCCLVALFCLLSLYIFKGNTCTTVLIAPILLTCYFLLQSYAYAWAYALHSGGRTLCSGIGTWFEAYISNINKPMLTQTDTMSDRSRIELLWLSDGNFAFALNLKLQFEWLYERLWKYSNVSCFREYAAKMPIPAAHLDSPAVLRVKAVSPHLDTCQPRPRDPLMHVHQKCI